MTADISRLLPSYENDFAKLDGGEIKELEEFDHLGAYRALGPIYSVQFRGEPWICIGGLEANAAAWKNPDIWNYEEALTPFREIMGPQHVTQMDGEAHREKRKQLKPGFAMSAIARTIPAIDSVIKQRLAANSGKSISLHSFFMIGLTYANAATLLKTPIVDEEVDTFIRFEEEFIGGTLMTDEKRRAFYDRACFKKDKAFVFEFLSTEIQSRLDGKEVDDNFSAVMGRTISDPEEIDMQELVSQAYLLLMAGTGNTAKLLNCGLQHIMRDVVWLSELREELSEYKETSLQAGMGAFPKLKATIMEIERLFPAAPVLSRVVEQPFEFEEHRLEKGTRVLHLQTLPQFLDEVFKDPYSFKPQRWLENRYPKKALGTFGGSTHVCLGMNIARVHIPIVLANILKSYELVSNDESNIEINVNYGVPQVADIKGVFSERP